MSSTAFIEPLPVIEFVTQLLNRDVQARPLSDSDRVKVRFLLSLFWTFWQLSCLFCVWITLGYALLDIHVFMFINFTY